MSWLLFFSIFRPRCPLHCTCGLPSVHDAQNCGFGIQCPGWLFNVTNNLISNVSFVDLKQSFSYFFLQKWRHCIGSLFDWVFYSNEQETQNFSGSPLRGRATCQQPRAPQLRGMRRQRAGHRTAPRSSELFPWYLILCFHGVFKARGKRVFFLADFFHSYFLGPPGGG